MYIYETKRLKFRVFKSGDEASMVEFWGNEEVMRFCPGPLGTVKSFKKTIDFYKGFYEETGYSVFGVVLKSSDKVIGACGFNPTDENGALEFLYHFNKDYWNQGYATEACKATMAFIHSFKDVIKIEASVHVKNYYSESILNKLGFEFIEKKWFSDSKAYENCYQYLNQL